MSVALLRPVRFMIDLILIITWFLSATYLFKYFHPFRSLSNFSSDSFAFLETFAYVCIACRTGGTVFRRAGLSLPLLPRSLCVSSRSSRSVAWRDTTAARETSKPSASAVFLPLPSHDSHSALASSLPPLVPLAWKTPNKIMPVLQAKFGRYWHGHSTMASLCVHTRSNHMWRLSRPQPSQLLWSRRVERRLG